MKGLVDFDEARAKRRTVGSPCCLALAIALAFEFVNGFHDTANAAACRPSSTIA
jgi:hypothetical protein